MFSFMPNKNSIKLSAVLLVILILGISFLILYRAHLSEGILILLCVFVPYLIIHSLYDILIRSRICFIFDSEEKMVYRRSPFFPPKKLMAFNDIVIFSRKIGGTWFYAIGEKKKHLIKNYRISEDFSWNKHISPAQTDYETYLLLRIEELIRSRT